MGEPCIKTESWGNTDGWQLCDNRKQLARNEMMGKLIYGALLFVRALLKAIIEVTAPQKLQQSK
jgi:hypothetical protein